MAHSSRRTLSPTPRLLLAPMLLAALVSCGGNGPSSPLATPPGTVPVNPPMKPGQTEFITDEAGQGQDNNKSGRGEATSAGNPGGLPAPNAPPSVPATDAAAPGGRIADVQEGDIYRVDKNRLFYLNTYRGFLIYDVNDPKKPERVARLPVFGYPIEMYIAGNTVYALLRDALYLTQVGGQPQFERHNVSQLVSIDITDLRNPKVLETIDIRGNLREGVSRKIDNTIYVVSYVPQSYSWGWRPDPTQQKEQAWVYSFNVANPQDLAKVGEHKIFEGGSVNESDGQGYYYNRSFSDVYISATANALMVAENWNTSASSSGGTPRDKVSNGCGSYNSTQRVHVSLIDISDPTGIIKPHVDFWTAGRISDQFKMTYVFDAAAKTGTFFGILGRQEWSATNCQGTSFMKNTLESWDVSVAQKPVRLDTLDFGKTRETVRGSAFDTDRKVAYAITAEQIDPLFALDISNPRDLKVLSEIDGLSGDMTVFRLVGDKQFLLGVGRDTSDACTGFQDTTQGWRSTKVAVSVIDVKDLTKIRLVQRQCVAVKNADWIGSDVTNDMDQAHKMLGMHADGSLNVLTVPVYYSKKVEPGTQNDWWWYSWETAVGLMSWDLTRYDAARAPAQQTVIQNHGSFVHPHGEVRRSIVFTHEAAAGNRRMMINLSDTHVSIADVQDLANPTLQSVIEVAPFYNQIYRFGDYLVEQVQSKPQSWGNPAQDVMTFRVKKAGGDLDGGATLKSFDIGQIFRVLKHDNSLVLFRQSPDPRTNPRLGVYFPPTTEALIVDMRNPAEPRLAGKVKVPTLSVPYYRYWCGMDAYWGGFWFDQDAAFAMVERGFAFYASEWVVDDSKTGQGHTSNKLVFLDVRNPDAPLVSEVKLPATEEWGAFGLVADPVDKTGFFITRRQKAGETKTADGETFTRYRYFAQRWQPTGDTWAAQHDVNTPGRLIRTWKSGNATGERMFLAQDTTYRTGMEGMNKVWYADHRLSLLRQVAVAGKPAAELLDTRTLTDLYPSSLLVEGGKLLLNARPQKNYFYGFGYRGGIGVPTATASPAVDGVAAAPAPLPSWESTSDHLMIIDTSANALTVTYDKPTRMFNVQLMGTHQGKLYVNLGGSNGYGGYDRGAVAGGDGILVIDVSNPAAPVGVSFLRTLGFASHIEFFGNDVYVAAGHFGLFHMDLAAPPSLPQEPQM